MTRPDRLLFYFADPMCSWCWGFAPVIRRIVESYRGRLAVSLVAGGLRAGNTQPMTSGLRAEILHHWREVNRMTGQPFRVEGALPEGFVYDTEPACRAAVTMPELDPQATFPYFQSLQSAFYERQQDITREEILVTLAAACGVDPDRFHERLGSDAMRAKTRRQFQMTRELGVRGFPTAVLADPRGYVLLTSGYRPFDELRPQIDEWLAELPNALH